VDGKNRKRRWLIALGLCFLAACGGDGDNPTDPGGGGNGGNGSLYAPPAATEGRTTGDLVEARDGHTATLLQDGRVLVTGGWNGRNKKASCELYDPTTETWSLTDSMGEGRFGHSATLLADGRVLVVGGTGDSNTTLRSWQLFDPETETWSPIVPWDHPVENGSNIRWPRSHHRATLLTNGDVLITGGFDSYRPTYSFGDYEYTYDLFYTANEQTDWRDGPYPIMLDKRFMHGSTLLDDGRVLLSGGFNQEDQYLTACEIYDAAGDSCLAVANMITPRQGHGAFQLADGRVFVCGGATAVNVYTRNCEIYNPATDTWSSTPAMREPRRQPSHVQLEDGRILVAGNTFSATVEACIPGGEWVYQHELLEARFLFTMTLFENGVILVAGGVDNTAPGNTGFMTSCELYVP
jgi:hypothetical protein